MRRITTVWLTLGLVAIACSDAPTSVRNGYLGVARNERGQVELILGRCGDEHVVDVVVRESSSERTLWHITSPGVHDGSVHDRHRAARVPHRASARGTAPRDLDLCDRGDHGSRVPAHLGRASGHASSAVMGPVQSQFDELDSMKAVRAAIVDGCRLYVAPQS